MDNYFKMKIVPFWEEDQNLNYDEDNYWYDHLIII